MKEFTITGWYIRDGDWDFITIEQKYNDFEKAKEAAEIHYKQRWIPKAYSMSITDGIDIWKWSPGKEWTIQKKMAA